VRVVVANEIVENPDVEKIRKVNDWGGRDVAQQGKALLE